jgi:hypothetical protein
MNTPEPWNSARDLAESEVIDLYIKSASRPEILSDFQHFSQKPRTTWTFPIHSKNDPCFPQILIFFIVGRIVLFDIGLVEDFD